MHLQLFPQTATNQIVIGYGTIGKGDNTVTIGNGDITAWSASDDNEVDLGSSSVEFKDLYIDGTANLDAVDIDGGAIDGYGYRCKFSIYWRIYFHNCQYFFGCNWIHRYHIRK